MSTSEERIQRIGDDLEIRDLVARFANACSPPNFDAFSNLWLPEDDSKPVWTLSHPFNMSASGNVEIMAMIDRLISPRDFFVQLVHSGVVEIDGDRATGRWILREIARGPGEVYYNNFAIYEDEMKKSNGRWYFARRDYKYIFLDDAPFEGKVFKFLTES